MSLVTSVRDEVPTAHDAVYDVAVAGGGPGGSTLAACLAKKGRRVVLFERETFPRFHLGESLLPCTLDVLERVGVLARFDQCLLRKYGARFIEGESGREVAFRFGDSLSSSSSHAYAFQGARAEIDDMMLARAVELGAEVHQAEVVGFRPAQDAALSPAEMAAPHGERAAPPRATAAPYGEMAVRDRSGNQRLVRARVLVDATGRSHLASRGEGATTKLPLLERTLAVFGHFDGCSRLEGESEGDLRVVVVPEGWFWIIPFRGDRTSIGLVLRSEALDRQLVALRADIEGFFTTACQRYPVLRDTMRGATRALPVGTAADFSYRVERLHGNGWLSVGDAAGFIDPIFSTGFHLAVRGAELAATAIDAGLDAPDAMAAKFLGYERTMRRAADTFVGIVQAFYDGPLLPLLFETQKKPWLKRMITSVLAGDVFHDDDEPRWLAEVRRLFPARSAVSNHRYPNDPAGQEGDSCG